MAHHSVPAWCCGRVAQRSSGRPPFRPIRVRAVSCEIRLPSPLSLRPGPPGADPMGRWLSPPPPRCRGAPTWSVALDCPWGWGRPPPPGPPGLPGQAPRPRGATPVPHAGPRRAEAGRRGAATARGMEGAAGAAVYIVGVRAGRAANVERVRVQCSAVLQPRAERRGVAPGRGVAWSAVQCSAVRCEVKCRPTSRRASRPGGCPGTTLSPRWVRLAVVHAAVLAVRRAFRSPGLGPVHSYSPAGMARLCRGRGAWSDRPNPQPPTKEAARPPWTDPWPC